MLFIILEFSRQVCWSAIVSLQKATSEEPLPVNLSVGIVIVRQKDPSISINPMKALTNGPAASGLDTRFPIQPGITIVNLLYHSFHPLHGCVPQRNNGFAPFDFAATAQVPNGIFRPTGSPLLTRSMDHCIAVTINETRDTHIVLYGNRRTARLRVFGCR